MTRTHALMILLLANLGWAMQKVSRREERSASFRFRGAANGSSSTSGHTVKVHFDNPTPYKYSEDESGGIPVDVYLPDDPTAGSHGQQFPLLIMLHGWNNEPSQVWSDFGFEDVTGISFGGYWIVAVPPGRRGSDGKRFWSAWGDGTGTCNQADGVKWYAQEDCNGGASVNTDVDYIQAVIRAVKDAYPVDDKKVYLFGHSNGAYMTYRMACDVGSKVFAGMAVFAGTLPEDNSLGRDAAYTCKAERPVPFLHIHGAQDNNVHYSGCDYSKESCAVDEAWAYRGAVASVVRLAELYKIPKGHGCLVPPVEKSSEAKDGGGCSPTAACNLGGNSYLPCEAYSTEPGIHATLTLIKNRFEKHDTEVYNISGPTPIALWKIKNAGHHPSGASGLSGSNAEWYFYEPAVKSWLMQHSKA